MWADNPGSRLEDRQVQLSGIHSWPDTAERASYPVLALVACRSVCFLFLEAQCDLHVVCKNVPQRLTPVLEDTPQLSDVTKSQGLRGKPSWRYWLWDRPVLVYCALVSLWISDSPCGRSLLNKLQLWYHPLLEVLTRDQAHCCLTQTVG